MKKPIGITILCAMQLVSVTAQVTLAALVLLGWRGLEGFHGAGADRLDLGPLLSGWGAAAVLLAFAAFQASIGYGLWTLRNWARVFVIVFLAVNAAGDLVVLVLYAAIWPDWAIALGAFVKGAVSVLVIRYLVSTGVQQAFGLRDGSRIV